MPPSNVYMGEWTPMYEGEEPPLHSTTSPPLAPRKYFQCVWENDAWVYAEAPLEPGVMVHPLDALLTYAECRARDYPNVADYVDGIVKADTEQVTAYIDACLVVKERWPKTMEPITLREYYARKA